MIHGNNFLVIFPMSSSDANLPRHVTLLGEALRTSLPVVEAQLSEPVCANGAEMNFAELAKAFDGLGKAMARLSREANGVLNDVLGATRLPDAQVYRAAGRFEMAFDELLHGYTELRRLRPNPEHKRGHELLLAIYHSIVTQYQGLLREVVETIADPMTAVRKRGLPTSGKVEVTLSLTCTIPKKLDDEMNEWISQCGSQG